MKLMIVGCSGSFAGPESPASCYLVQCHDGAGRRWTIALDMGSGAFGPLQRIMAPEALDCVALTHLHPDHCADMTGLHVYAKYRPGTALETLPVYGPAGTSQQLDSLQYSLHQNSRFNTIHWRLGQSVQVGPMCIVPYPVMHPVEAWGFHITGPSGIGRGQCTLGFSGDTDICPGLDELAAGVDLLLIEAAFQEGRDSAPGVHLTGRRAGLVAQKARAKRVVVTHIPPWYDAEETMTELAQAYDGPFHLAKSYHSYVI